MHRFFSYRLIAVDSFFWWSWGESNPRPKAFVRQIYTLS